jgi:hypothetical protein
LTVSAKAENESFEAEDPYNATTVHNKQTKNMIRIQKFKLNGLAFRCRVFLIVSLAVLAFPLLMLAQTNPASTGSAPPTSAISPWMALIPLAVPVLIALLKMVVPSLPGVWLPLLAPLLGAAADIFLHYAGVSTLGPTWGALLGSAGVGLREIQDQVRQSIGGGAPQAPGGSPQGPK